jgi:putative hydrolase of the HAD superfamily
VRLVCFDLGGVLVRLCRDLDDACARAGVVLPPTVAPVAIWPVIMTQARRLNAGELDLEAYGAAVAAALGGAVSAADVCALHAAWVLGEYDGARALIGEVHALGLDSAILSNTDESHWRPIRARGIGALVHHGFASHELGVLKPAPAAYAAVEGALGVAPAEILFFDDTAENVAAARARGWQAHAVDREAETVPQMQNVLRSLCRLT